MKYRIVAHHPVADVYWHSEWAEQTEGQVNDLSEMIKEMCKGAGYWTMVDESGRQVFFPEKMIQQLVITLEKSNEQ